MKMTFANLYFYSKNLLINQINYSFMKKPTLSFFFAWHFLCYRHKLKLKLLSILKMEKRFY